MASIIMENEPYLSVIIPAYNEEKSISKTLLAMDEYLQKQPFGYEILVCDGGSKDKTREIVGSFEKTIKNLRLLCVTGGIGKGHVVRRGMLEAKGQYRLFTDADNSTSIDHVEKMKPYFGQDYEVIIGTRDSRDDKTARQAVAQSFIKRLLGDMGNLLIQALVVPGIWDTQCGFKAFSAKAAEKIFPLVTIQRWGFDIEILGLAKKLGYKIAIVPVYWINNPDSRVGLSGYLTTLTDLFKIKWNLITNKYGLRG